jgi:hypothetical protein
MAKKKIPNEEEKTLYDFGFGLVNPKDSDFAALAKGIGLDPDELASFLSTKKIKEQK